MLELLVLTGSFVMTCYAAAFPCSPFAALAPHKANGLICYKGKSILFNASDVCQEPAGNQASSAVATAGSNGNGHQDGDLELGNSQQTQSRTVARALPKVSHTPLKTSSCTVNAQAINQNQKEYRTGTAAVYSVQSFYACHTHHVSALQMSVSKTGMEFAARLLLA